MTPEINLSKYIDSRRSMPFVWGKNDCLTFASGCIIAQTGKNPLKDMLGNYKCPSTAILHIKRSIKKFRYDPTISMSEAIDDRLKRIYGPFPPRGSITSRKVGFEESVTGQMLGVTLRRKSAFLSQSGIVFLDREKEDLFWSVAG